MGKEWGWVFAPEDKGVYSIHLKVDLFNLSRIVWVCPLAIPGFDSLEQPGCIESREICSSTSADNNFNHSLGDFDMT